MGDFKPEDENSNDSITEFKLSPDNLDILDTQALRQELVAAHQQLIAHEEELRQQLDELEKNQLFLAEANQKLSEIIDFLPDATFVIDLEGKVVTWNRAMEDLTGVETSDIIGKADHEYSIPFYGDRVPMVIDVALGSDAISFKSIPNLKRVGRVFSTQNWYPTINGNAYLVGMSTPLYDPSGKVVGAIETIRDLTEIKHFESSLQASEERYRNIIESIGEGYFEADANGFITFANSTLCESIGYSHDEIIGLHYKNVMDTNNATQVFKAFRHVYLTGELVRDFAWEVINRDGERLLVETTVLPIQENPEKEIRGFRGIVRDVTLKKFIEEALRTSENLYRAIFENTGTASIIIDEDTRMVLANTQMEKLSGYNSRELLGQSWQVLIHQADLERMLDYHYKRRIPGFSPPRHYEFSLVTKSGRVKNISMTIGMIPESNRSIASLSDITETKQTAEALIQSENELRRQVDYLHTLIESMNEIFLTFDSEGIITFVNRRGTETLGFSSEELVGELFADLAYSDQSKAKIKRAISEVIGFRGTGVLEVPLLVKNGDQRVLSLSYSPIITEDELFGGMIIAEDITDALHDKERLTYISEHDALTGLYNRAYFEKEMKKIDVFGEEQVALMIADVDGLKLINDTMGHESGDKVLRITGEIFNHLCPDSCFAARIGGDEFAIIMRQANNDKISECINKIRANITDHNEGNPGLPLSISMGFAIRPDDCTPMADIFREADNNMYREKLHIGQSARSAIVRTLARALGARDFMTEGHGERLQSLSNKVGVALGLNSRRIRDMQLLSQFHDIGKVGVSDAVLFKPGPLDDHEFEEMKRHCEIGHRIALSASEMTVIADWILKHHEWWNGKGYPLGLEGFEIPLECRILAIVDAYDAMTSDRPYRKAMSPVLAFQELRRCAGSQFDPELVEVFLGLFESQKPC
ncbi:MAG: PAS domain S-box protein [Ignavibacteriales bacterium]